MTLKYIIISQPRSGTHMLRSMIPGCEGELYNDAPIDLKSLDCMGFCLHSRHAFEMLEQINKLQPRIVSLTRRDRFTQAISYAVAGRSGFWFGANPTEKIEGINLEELISFTITQDYWHTYVFSRLDCPRIHIQYEKIPKLTLSKYLGIQLTDRNTMPTGLDYSSAIPNYFDLERRYKEWENVNLSTTGSKRVWFETEGR